MIEDRMRGRQERQGKMIRGKMMGGEGGGAIQRAGQND